MAPSSASYDRSLYLSCYYKNTYLDLIKLVMMQSKILIESSDGSFYSKTSPKSVYAVSLRIECFDGNIWAIS